MIDRPGIYFDIDPKNYFADPCKEPSLNQSLAKLLLEKSPLHAKYAHPRLTPQSAEDEDDKPEKYDKDKAIGNAAHALILGRGKDLAIGEFDAWTTKAAKEFKLDAYRSGEEPILRKHYQAAWRLAASVKEQLSAHQCNDCFIGGKSEAVIAWQEEGFWFRSMIDFVHDDLRVFDDLKTTGMSASPQSIPWMIDDMGWDIQAAMWERGLNIIDPENAGRRRYRFIAVENEPPFALTVNDLSEAVLTIGRRRLRAAIERWKRCMKLNDWPAYPTTCLYPEFPGARAIRWEERERELADAGMDLPATKEMV